MDEHDVVVNFDIMGLNETDKAWVRLEIAASHNRHGWSKLLAFLKDWSGVFGFGGMVAAAFLFWGQYNAFQTRTVDRLENIDRTLLSMQASTEPKQALSVLAAMPAPSLEKNLLTLRKVAEQNPSTVRPSKGALSDVQRTLQTVNQSAPGYWPTVNKFLEFASYAASPGVPQHGSLPYVELTDVAAGSFLKIPQNSTVKLSGRIEGITFTNDRIIFSKDGVLLINVRFVGCAFEFEDDSEAPPKNQQHLERTLLASDLQSAFVPASSGE